jgi:hypothetical protein
VLLVVYVCFNTLYSFVPVTKLNIFNYKALRSNKKLNVFGFLGVLFSLNMNMNFYNAVHKSCSYFLEDLYERGRVKTNSVSLEIFG